MSKQNPRDQISKASWNLMEGIKDAVTANVTTAARTSLKVEPAELAKLLLILNASVEEGYHRASRVFAKSVDVALETTSDAAWDQGNTASGAKSKKKSP